MKSSLARPNTPDRQPFYRVGETPHIIEGGFIVNSAHGKTRDYLAMRCPSGAGIPCMDLFYWRRPFDQRCAVALRSGVVIYHPV